MSIDMTCIENGIRIQSMSTNFATGDYSMDVEVNVGLRLSAAKARAETEVGTLALLLKTDRQKRIYREIQKRFKKAAQS